MHKVLVEALVAESERKHEHYLAHLHAKRVAERYARNGHHG